MIKIYVEGIYNENDENNLSNITLNVNPDEIGTYIESSTFALRFMVESPERDCIGMTPPGGIPINVAINYLQAGLYDERWKPFSRNWHKEKSKDVLFYLRHIADKFNNLKWVYERETIELEKENEKLKKEIETLKTRDYKNRALKASLTRANKIINLLTNEKQAV